MASQTTDFVGEFIEKIKNEVQGLIAVTVVEVQTGMTFGSFSGVKSFDPEIASAYNVEVVKAKLKAVEALGLSDKIDDILITLSSQIHLIKMAPNQKIFIYLAADSTKANLGMARAVLRKYSEEIESNL